MTEPSPATLREILEEEAAGLEAAEARSAPAGGVEWSIGGRVFAAADGPRAEFRLDPMIAAAALRTPDTSPSSRGGDWVAFAPPVVDQHALDRAGAWLASAWRRADGES